MRRQEILARTDPVRLSVVLDEPAIRRLIGGPMVMREQLRHLLTTAERTNVDIRLLPFTVGAHASLMNPFEILEVGEPYPDVAYIEVPLRGLEAVAAEDVGMVEVRFQRLSSAALDEKESARLLAAAAEED